jgi:hypothetical protein
MGEKPAKTPLAIVGAPASVVGAPGTVPPPPPRDLGASGLGLWNSIQGEYRISDAGGVELLMQACQAADRLAGLVARIAEDGEVIVTRSGPKSHPLIREETSLRGFLCRTLGKLGVTDQPLKSVGRPPNGGLGWRGPQHADK